MEEHQKLLNVNVLGAYHTAQFAAKQMIKNGTKNGSLIMIASLGSHVAIKSQGSSAYCGTKGAIKAMVPQIACELRKYVSQGTPQVYALSDLDGRIFESIR